MYAYDDNNYIETFPISQKPSSKLKQ